MPLMRSMRRPEAGAAFAIIYQDGIGRVMHVRGNKPASTAAKVIMALVVIVGVATAAIAIYAVSREPATKRGAQAMPGQVAEQLGQDRQPAALPK